MELWVLSSRRRWPKLCVFLEVWILSRRRRGEGDSYEFELPAFLLPPLGDSY
jgi:hypothetical protein